MVETLKNLDSLRLNFSPSGLLMLNISLAIIMFGIALELKADNFKKILQNPRAALVGASSQLFVLPLVTFIIVILCHKYITPTIAMGMILVAACPGGNISNYISKLAKGNVELAISLTAFSTITALIMTPFNFSFYGGLYSKIMTGDQAGKLLRPLEIDSLQMFQTVFIILGIPILIGIFISNRYPLFTQKIIGSIKKTSLLLFAGIVIGALAGNFSYFVKYAPVVFTLVILHNGVAFFSGYWYAKSFKLSRINCRTISIETGIHNTGLGLVLLFNEKIFPPELAIGGMAFIAAGWGIWHMIAGGILASIWNRRQYPNS
jgi:BASS family bile acid:Na+ symporter